VRQLLFIRASFGRRRAGVYSPHNRGVCKTGDSCALVTDAGGNFKVTVSSAAALLDTITKVGWTCWSAPFEENERSDVRPRFCRSRHFARELSVTAEQQLSPTKPSCARSAAIEK